MCASRWIKVTLLLHLFCSATSSPLSTHTSAPLLTSQIPSPYPTILPSADWIDLSESALCPLTLSPSSLVVRFGDPVKVNCSVPMKGFSLLGWEVTLLAPEPTMDSFLVWKVDHMSEWSISPMCYAVSDLGGPCHRPLPVLVYKPPDSVSLSFANHTGSLLEHNQYTLHCTVHDVAPSRNLVVTFYRNQTRLARLRSNVTDKTPVTEIFPLNIVAMREDDGANYWCEAELQLQLMTTKKPVTVVSEKVATTVLFGPQLLCPTKLRVKMGESLHCDVRGNPEPSVIWLKDGRRVIPPTHSTRAHAGKYTVLATGLFGQKNVTVEVEVVTCRGTASVCEGLFLLLFVLMLNVL
ncbi:MAM domain-containing glycosylphosphatidylinositol anchor protein 1-like [Corythoichthys intestinalis]|uniref:MAM domain-containing glycosylphosphatidylinositol anchor protein 1-like n=1 Tax=Corythoichthys intestinalis TaxID=161448 RepID=UPI0025A5D8A9|nr:MAM domain-containing glycosylphosphatidylinositol anchor protein 1-like [Corythoichthys intestinalis]